MSIDPYVGSAGGQPRLLLPNMKGFGRKMDANLRTLYTWANSLRLGGSSGSSFIFRFTTNLWYPASFLDTLAAPVQNAPGTGNSQYYPFLIDIPGNGFKTAGIHVLQAGNAGDKLEVGVYADTGGGAPGALISDWGSISLAALGAQTLSITWTPTFGLYWLSILQLSTGNPQWQLLPEALWPYGLPNPVATTGYYGYYINGIAALPATAAGASLNPNQGGAYSPFLQAA